jgi:hypothetical protein
MPRTKLAGTATLAAESQKEIHKTNTDSHNMLQSALQSKGIQFSMESLGESHSNLSQVFRHAAQRSQKSSEK